MIPDLPTAALTPPEPSAWPDAPTFISLSREAGSAAAATFAAGIAAQTEPFLGRTRPLGTAGRQSHCQAIAAVLAGLLKAGLRGEAVRAQRGKSDKARQWQRAPGTTKPTIGYDVFWSKISALGAAGLAEEQAGISYHSGFGMTGAATRIRCTSALLDRARAAGMSAETFGTDWPVSATAQLARPELWGDAVRCLEVPLPARKAAAIGAFPDAQEARVEAITAHLERLNAHLSRASVAGCVPPVLVRKFFSDARLGGRFYAIGGDPYQTMRGDDRRRLLRIDGQPVAEVDLRASVLSVLLAIAGQAIPTDPYAAGLLATFDREAVKAFFTQALNGGRLPVKWSPGYNAAVRAAPLGRIRAAAVEVYPALAEATALLPADLAGKLIDRRGELGWGLGQWLVAIEAEVMEDALATLMDAGVVALPLHDALLCRQDDVEEARRGLVEAFARRLGREPQVRVEGAF